MSRMTHFTNQSKTILFWDYYILCRLDTEAAMILQRLEYWDGVKNNSNIVAEDMNDELVENGYDATQDTEQFVYKSQDELKWELMGLVGTNNLAIKLKLLTTDLLFVISRNNPLNPTDRKRQYHMAKDYVQIRLDYLSNIVATFQKASFRMNAVYYAIEDLAKENVYVEDLNVTQVAKKLVALCQQAEIDDTKALEDRELQKVFKKDAKKPKPYEPILPKFLRIQLKKDKPMIEGLDLSSEVPTFNFKEWESLKLKNDQALKLKVVIPQNQRISSNYVSSNYNQKIQDSKCVEASDSLTETDKHTPIDNDLNPLGIKIPETPLPKREVPIEEPFGNLPWGAKKALDTTEAIVNTTYTNVDVTLRTCQKILDTYHPTEEEYIGVVSKALVWYEANNRILEPVNLLAFNREGRVWFEVFLGEFKRYGFNGKPVSTQSQEPETYTASNVRTEDTLPDRYVDAIDTLARYFNYEQYLTTLTINNIEDVYLFLARLGAAPHVFDAMFTQCLAETNSVSIDQVRAKRYEDYLDYLCREMQRMCAEYEEQHSAVVEGDLVRN